MRANFGLAKFGSKDFSSRKRGKNFRPDSRNRLKDISPGDGLELIPRISKDRLAKCKIKCKDHSFLSGFIVYVYVICA